MKSKEWVAVIAVVLIVAVIASLVTVNITGNIIKVPTSVATTQTEVYTKADMDRIMTNYTENLFKRAHSTNEYWLGNTRPVIDGFSAYNSHHSKCLIGQVKFIYPNDEQISSIIPCNQILNITEMRRHNDWVNGTDVSGKYLCIKPDIWLISVKQE